MAAEDTGAARAGFTLIPSAWPRALAAANLTGAEWAVLVALAQYPREDGTLSRPMDDFGRDVAGLISATGLKRQTVKNALHSLTTKTFPGQDGEPVPVLTRVGQVAHAGRAAVFRCNLPGSTTSGKGKRKGGRGKRATGRKGTQGREKGFTGEYPTTPDSSTQVGPSEVPNYPVSKYPNKKEERSGMEEPAPLSRAGSIPDFLRF